MATTTSPQVRTPFRIFLFGSLAELLFGYDLGIIGVALLSIKTTFPLNSTTTGLVVSSLLLGAAVGVAAAGRIADRIGRKPALYITSALFLSGGLLAAAAGTLPILIAGRLLMGLGVGASASVVTVYLVEAAPTRHRAKIGSLGQLMVVLGILIANIVGYALAQAGLWRIMLGASAIPALILAIGLTALPESPRWLVSRGRQDDARRALQRLGHGQQADTTLGQLQHVHNSAAEETVHSLGSVLRAMFAPGMRRNGPAAILLAILVQLIGTNSILYYAPSALIHAGFTQAAAVIANLSVGTANVLFTVIGLALVDRIPRRSVLTTGIAGMLAAMVFLSLISYIDTPSSPTTGWPTLAGMLLFQISFAASWGLLTRVVVSELFPSSIRGTATGLVLVTNWLANFLVGQTFPAMMALSAGLSFAVFAVAALFALVFVRAVLPETGAGRTLEQIQEQTTASRPQSIAGQPKTNTI